MNFSLRLNGQIATFDYVKYFHLLKWFELDFLKALIEQSLSHRMDYASMDYLAKRAGISRTYAFMALKRLKEDGIIESINRGMKSTCVRLLSPIFKDPNIFLKCRHLFGRVAQKVLAAMNDYIFSLFVDRDKVLHERKSKVCTQRYSISINSISILDHVREEKRHTRAESRVDTQGKKESMYPAEILGKRLTEYGRIKLMAYPERIVHLVATAIKFPNTVQSPMAYFETRCRKECDTRSIRPDYHLVKRLCMERNLSPDSPIFVTSPIASTIPPHQQETEEQVSQRLAAVRQRRLQRHPHQQTSDNTHSLFSASYWASILGV